MRIYGRLSSGKRNWDPIEFNSKGKPVLDSAKSYTAFAVRGTWFSVKKNKIDRQVSESVKTLDEAKVPLNRLRALKDGTIAPTAPTLDASGRMRIADQVVHFLARADADETDTILFALYTGFRRGEVTHTRYSDINFAGGKINVSDKPEFAWRIKDREERPAGIDVPKDFIQRMRNRMQRRNASLDNLIFTNERNENPDVSILRKIRNVAARKGADVLKSRGGEISADLKPLLRVDIPESFIKKIDMKKFRRTFATTVANTQGIEKARDLLGHSKVEITQMYLAAEEIDIEENHETKVAVENMWSAVGD